MSSDADRIAYLAGDQPAAPVDPDDAADLDELRDLLADPGLWDEPDEGLEDAVVSAVVAASAAAPRRSEPPAVASSLAAHRRRRFLRSTSLAAAAAVAAAVVVGVVLVTTRGGGDADVPRFEVALAPTELAPGAAGSVVATRTDSGWRIELDATGLPRLDGGQFYEAWLLGPDDVLVPVGTFNEGADVVLWAGVSPADFTTFTVTREVADGDQSSSGERVLAGPAEPSDDG